MNSQNILTAFMAHGADIETIALIAETDSKQVQAAMRAEMLRLAEQSQPSVSAEPAPLTTARKAQAADSSPSPAPKNCAAAMRKSPARKAVEKAANPQEYAEFPEPLRHPLAIKQRALYLMLKTGPKDVAELVSMAEAAGVQEADIYKWVSNGLYGMQQKDIAIKPEITGGKWRLA